MQSDPSMLVPGDGPSTHAPPTPGAERSRAYVFETITRAYRTRERRRLERDAISESARMRGLAERRGRSAWIGKWSRQCDTVVAITVLSMVVLFANRWMAFSQIESYLAVRITLKNALLGAGFVFFWPKALTVAGAYDERRSSTLPGVMLTVLLGCTVGSLFAALIPLTSHSGTLGVSALPVIWSGTIVGTLLVRFATRFGTFVERVRTPTRRVVIAGSGPRAAALWTDLREHPRFRYDLVAVADLPSAQVALSLSKCHRVDLATLEQFCMQTVVDEVIVALPVRSRYKEIEQTLQICERMGIHSLYLSDAFSPTMARARVGEAGRFSVVSMHVVGDGWGLTVKRAFDVVIAGALLAMLSPLMLGVAVAVAATSPGPILFSQERYGLRKRRFRMLKFRTMARDAERLQDELEDKNEAAGPVFKIAHDPRVTRLGRFLRRTSLDELPQLWNVVKGDMSLVGPRPLPIRDVSRFEASWLTRRFSVRPGLTCLWQVSGRSTLSFEDWITLDLKYIDEWSLRLDFALLLKTVPAVLSGRGAI